MSWDAHLAKLTTAVKCRGGLYGHNGVRWAGDAPVSDEEIKYIVNGFTNPGSLFAAGPKVSGDKYMCTRADEHLIIGKKGTHGFIAVKSVQSVVFCFFDEADTTPGNANTASQNFADYLKGLGF